MNTQRVSLSSSFPEFLPALQGLNANLEKMSDLEKELPIHYEQLDDISERVSNIFDEMKKQVNGYEERRAILELNFESIIEQGGRTPDVDKIRQEFKGLNTIVKKQVKKSGEVLNLFTTLVEESNQIAEKILKAEMEREGFRAQKKRKAKRAVVKEQSNQSDEGQEINRLFISEVEKMERIALPQNQQKKVGLLVSKIKIFPKKVAVNAPAFIGKLYQDVTGIAELLEVEGNNPLMARRVAIKHLLKRIYILRLLMDLVHQYSKKIKECGINRNVSAQEAYIPEGTIPAYYQNAHISPLAQLQLHLSSPVYHEDGSFTVDILNPNVSVKKYFIWSKKEEVLLNTILNCADVVPKYINLIDNMSETYDREYIFDMLEQVVEGVPVDKAYDGMLRKMSSTLNTVLLNLKCRNPREHTYSINLISTNEMHLFKAHLFQPKVVEFATEGMVTALNAFIGSRGPLIPLSQRVLEQIYNI